MASKKPVAKPATKKPAPKKAVAKPVKKVAPAKKAATPAPKAVAKKPVKAIAKPVAKKVVKPVAVAPKKAVKPVAKPIAKVTKPAPKVVAPKKPIIIQKNVLKTPDLKKTPTKILAKAAEKAPVKEPVTAKAIDKKPKDIKVAPPKPVVIPKINHKTSRKYAPDFTKSVLDQVKNDPGAPIVRYSDNDLVEFKELIQRKLGAAKKELSYLQGLITRKDEMGGDESDNRYMTMEDGSLSMEREQLSQMASRQITFIDHLEKALMRIENQTYGICRVTGKLIDKARLKAVPHATLSIEAKMGIVK